MMKGRGSHCSAEEWLKIPGPMVWRRTFPGQPEHVRDARRLAAALFAGTGREDDVALIVSELATNACAYTHSGKPGGWFGLEVLLDELAYVAVTDLGGAGVPALRTNLSVKDEPCLGGRGLFLVADLSFTVGVHGSPSLGHTVWSDVDLRTKAAEAARLVS